VDGLVGTDEGETCPTELVRGKHAWGLGSGEVRLAINTFLVKKEGDLVGTDEGKTSPSGLERGKHALVGSG